VLFLYVFIWCPSVAFSELFNVFGCVVLYAFWVQVACVFNVFYVFSMVLVH